MFIFKVTYKVSIPKMEQHLAAHRAYLDTLFSDGVAIASGPREPRVGGIYLCNTNTLDEAKHIMANDPFYVEGVADYELIQFHVTKHNTSNFEASFEQ